MGRSHRLISSGVFLTLLVSFGAGWYLSAYYHAPLNNISNVDQPQNQEDLEPAGQNNLDVGSDQADLSTFWRVWEVIDDSYVRPAELSTQERVYGAIEGMVKAVGDSYTVFMNPRQAAEFSLSLTGQFEGVGMELTVEKGLLTVVSPLKNSPAERAGIKPGDVIYEINGEFSSEMTVFDAIMAIRGPKGTTVDLIILREEKEEPLEISIVREKIELDSVSFEMKDENIAYISINQFDESTADEFHQAVNQVLLSDAKSLILDLRYNGGGLLDSAVEILSEFIEGEKAAVIIRQRDPKDDEVVYTYGDARLTDIPIVVLVNEGSASASEIVAGAIRDHQRGIVLGAQTFGKGSVQELFQLPDSSNLRVTVALWYTPNENSIEDVGITPDRVVEITEEDEANEVDSQLNAAMEYLRKL